MTTYYLHCNRDSPHPRIVSDDGTHSFAVYSDSPLGKALAKTTEPGEYVTVDSIEPFSGHMQGPFSDVQSAGMDVHPALNVGKDWVFRSFFTTGHEMIGEKTTSTMQSFQTRLKRCTGQMSDCFDVVTLVSGCHMKRPVAIEVVHHFCLKPDNGTTAGPTMSQSSASADVKKDLKTILMHAGERLGMQMSVPSVRADDFYEYRESKMMQAGIDTGSAIVNARFG